MKEEIARVVEELTSGLLAEMSRVVAERNELHDALAGIRTAITDEEKMPDYHKAVMKRHREEWGTLWIAIDRAIDVLEGRAP